MNSLKKALTRDDPKKYHKTKIEISELKKHQQSHDIEWMFLKVSSWGCRRQKKDHRRTK
jgi:hypothetical protein